MPVAEIAAAIGGAVRAPDSPSAPRPEWERPALAALYEPGHYAPLWTDERGRPKPDVGEALALLARAPDEGLDPVDYRADWLEQYARRIETDAPSASEIAGFDAALSRSVLRYYRHVHRGRIDPRDVGYAESATIGADEVVGLVRSAIADHRITERAIELAPRAGEYGELRAMLVRYRALAGGARLAPPALPGPVRPGQATSGLDSLYRLLVALGDLPRGSLSPDTLVRFDGALVAGVKRFQARHGIDANGVLGSDTQAAFGVAFPQRVRQIELALERVRWWPNADGDRVVVINSPMSRLWAWNADGLRAAPVLSVAVVAGRAPIARPSLTERVHEVVFQPDANDERRCHEGTLVPYLVAWGVGIGRGCPRVADPVGLAVWALSGQPGWTEARVRAAIGGTGPSRVALARPVRIVRSDSTAAMPGDGALHFAADVYARDEELHRALIGRPRLE